MSATELARRLRAGALSPAQNLESTLDAISLRDKDIHAFLHVRSKEALLAEARQLEQAPRDSWGPLAGVPIERRVLSHAFETSVAVFITVARRTFAASDLRGPGLGRLLSKSSFIRSAAYRGVPAASDWASNANHKGSARSVECESNPFHAHLPPTCELSSLAPCRFLPI